MDYEEKEAPPKDEEEQFIIDPDTIPLVNIVTFGSIEGK
jgi:hypothetical protein